jgi:hypothetical protein
VRPRRWDDDPSGRGVATARGFAAPVRRLLEAMDQPDWVAEEPELHVLPHLLAMLSRPDSPLRLLGTRTDVDGTFVVDLEWTGPAPSRREQRRAIFALVGTIAEAATTVHEQAREDGATFQVVTGLLEGDGPFTSHGHTLLLRVLSPARGTHPT